MIATPPIGPGTAWAVPPAAIADTNCSACAALNGDSEYCKRDSNWLTTPRAPSVCS